jgi:hypothetical protein
LHRVERYFDYDVYAFGTFIKDQSLFAQCRLDAHHLTIAALHRTPYWASLLPPSVGRSLAADWRSKAKTCAFTAQPHHRRSELLVRRSGGGQATRQTGSRLVMMAVVVATMAMVKLVGTVEPHRRNRGWFAKPG